MKVVDIRNNNDNNNELMGIIMRTIMKTIIKGTRNKNECNNGKCNYMK